MYLLVWIVVGAVVGLGAGRIFQGTGYGPLMDILMGIGGGVVGGFAMSFAGLGGYRGTIITTLVAMVGAVLLTVLAAYVNGRRLYAMQGRRSRHSSHLGSSAAGQRHCQPMCAYPKL